jgi:hypothetical protein
VTFTVEDAILGSTLIPVSPVVHLRRSWLRQGFITRPAASAASPASARSSLTPEGLADRNGGGASLHNAWARAPHSPAKRCGWCFVSIACLTLCLLHKLLRFGRYRNAAINV